MGLGGYLTWTAAAKNICDRISGVKVIPFESHNNLIRPIKSEIFFNNPKIIQDFSDNNLDYCVPMILNNPSANYCKKDTPIKAIHRYDKHIIEQICETFGIQDPELKCELFLTEQEQSWADQFFGEHSSNKKTIVIEPQSNDEYSCNKVYPFTKWQMVVNKLSRNKNYKIIQVGKRTNNKILEGVLDLTGKTSFRQASAIIKNADLFVSSEGGLMHAANAVETPAVIVYSGFIHPNMTGYKNNSNIWVGESHGPCGMKIKCDLCESDMKNHNHDEILEAIEEQLR